MDARWSPPALHPIFGQIKLGQFVEGDLAKRADGTGRDGLVLRNVRRSSRLMKSGPPPLLPLLRSPLQAEVLTRLLLEPERAMSLTELARLTGASVATVQREVERAEMAGIARSERVGPTRLVRADPSSPLYRPLADLLLVAFGPVPVVSTELDGIDGIEEAYLFGSWAARYSGELGAAPRDVDVLVVGDPDRDQVYDAVERAERRLHRPVQVTFRSVDEWANEEDPFVSTVRSRPLVRIDVGDRR